MRFNTVSVEKIGRVIRVERRRLIFCNLVLVSESLPT